MFFRKKDDPRDDFTLDESRLPYWIPVDKPFKAL